MVSVEPINAPLRLSVEARPGGGVRWTLMPDGVGRPRGTLDTPSMAEAAAQLPEIVASARRAIAAWDAHRTRPFGAGQVAQALRAEVVRALGGRWTVTVHDDYPRRLAFAWLIRHGDDDQHVAKVEETGRRLPGRRRSAALRRGVARRARARHPRDRRRRARLPGAAVAAGRGARPPLRRAGGVRSPRGRRHRHVRRPPGPAAGRPALHPAHRRRRDGRPRRGPRPGPRDPRGDRPPPGARVAGVRSGMVGVPTDLVRRVTPELADHRERVLAHPGVKAYYARFEA